MKVNSTRSHHLASGMGNPPWLRKADQIKTSSTSDPQRLKTKCRMIVFIAAEGCISPKALNSGTKARALISANQLVACCSAPASHNILKHRRAQGKLVASKKHRYSNKRIEDEAQRANTPRRKQFLPSTVRREDKAHREDNPPCRPVCCASAMPSLVEEPWHYETLALTRHQLNLLPVVKDHGLARCGD